MTELPDDTPAWDEEDVRELIDIVKNCRAGDLSCGVIFSFARPDLSDESEVQIFGGSDWLSQGIKEIVDQFEAGRIPMKVRDMLSPFVPLRECYFPTYKAALERRIRNLTKQYSLESKANARLTAKERADVKAYFKEDR